MPNLCESSLENQGSNKNSIDSDHLSNYSQNVSPTTAASGSKIRRSEGCLTESVERLSSPGVEGPDENKTDTTVKLTNGASDCCDNETENENEIVVISGQGCDNNDSGNHEDEVHSVSVRVRKPPTKASMLDPRFFCCFLNQSYGSGIGEPSVNHALVVIFLEFFAWGLLTTPMISVLNDTFPKHTFLMNGLIVGIKGFLSFLSAPLIGALSDVWGRKLFLILTVFFTCAPIPLMQINTWWYFAMISISGVFAVTFSVVFAYVADVTPGEEERSAAYGLVSATFAASLVTSPALGAYVEEAYGKATVVALATAIAALDVIFVLVAVPESLPQKLRVSAWAPLAWEQADPFAALRKVGQDKTILLLCVTVLLSYLPEAGQYSCFFVYLRLVVGFKPEEVATFIAVVGIMSVVAQTAILGLLMKNLGARKTIVIGLLFEMSNLAWYGFGSERWMMWAAGLLAALSSITYPAISAFVSTSADADKQGLAQGMVTGMRGLCNGLGPAVFGLIFYLFHVDLNADEATLMAVDKGTSSPSNTTSEISHHKLVEHMIPGPPFVFGSLMVLLAISVALFIPEKKSMKIRRPGSDDLVDLENPQGTSQNTCQSMAPLIPQDPAIL